MHWGSLLGLCHHCSLFAPSSFCARFIYENSKQDYFWDSSLKSTGNSILPVQTLPSTVIPPLNQTPYHCIVLTQVHAFLSWILDFMFCTLPNALLWIRQHLLNFPCLKSRYLTTTTREKERTWTYYHAVIFLWCIYVASDPIFIYLYIIYYSSIQNV